MSWAKNSNGAKLLERVPGIESEMTAVCKAEANDRDAMMSDFESKAATGVELIAFLLPL